MIAWERVNTLLLIGGPCLANYGFVTFGPDGDRFKGSPLRWHSLSSILGDGGEEVQALDHLAADCGYRYIA